jgi:mycothiol S-conjugate amidase
MDEQLCLLTVHAHPDDEASKGPGTVAKYHADGVRTVLVTCTGGEEGEILNPAMDLPEIRADIAAVRAEELATAAKVIGYDEVELLGYRDSGMPGTEANANPASFGAADFDEALGRLVAIIRRFRPQVIIGYGEDHSGYPHPDHIRAHEIALAAFDAAGDQSLFPETGEAYEPAKLYYTVWSRKRILESHAKFIELGLESPYDQSWFERAEKRADDEEKVTTTIDLAGFEDVRKDALLAHATQIDPTSRFWFGLPDEEARKIYPYDDYILAKSRVATDLPETDLFAGLRQPSS